MGSIQPFFSGGARGFSSGQASTETLVLLGFILVTSVPLIFFLYAASNMQGSDVGLAQAKVSASAIADAANEVLVQGDGSRRLIRVAYPSGMLNVSVSDREVVLYMRPYGPSDTQIVARSIANLTDGSKPLWNVSRFGMGMATVKVECVNASQRLVSVGYA